ncbi:hypothetical protein F7725_026011 [Dissostichus mawsoni]|uniref:PARP catalytic domain-containing protein n=1 Tax=Dissostichus mawsoni TaxID=36200 RepID=A0A7J5X5W6_DISMA|nr:hypothetical protein F7725_026011 [Dissostichus mawsoni]
MPRIPNCSIDTPPPSVIVFHIRRRTESASSSNHHTKPLMCHVLTSISHFIPEFLLPFICGPFPFPHPGQACVWKLMIIVNPHHTSPSLRGLVQLLSDPSFLPALFKPKLHGAAYGKGIYLSPISSISFGYSGMGKGQHRMPTKDELVQRYNRMNTIPQSRPIQSRFLQSRNLNCIALCEVITSKDLQKHGNIWDGQVGDANINTQEPKVQKEIMRVIGTQIYSS